VKLVKIGEIVFMENEEAEFKVLFAKYLAWKDSQNHNLMDTNEVLLNLLV